MQVLHVYRTYFPDTQGGLEEAIRQICRATRRYGVSNRVFTVSARPDPPVVHMAEAEVIRVRRSVEIASCGFSTLGGVATFKQVASEHDVIHYHLPWPFADMLHLGLGIDRPSVATYHSDVVRQRFLDALYRPLRSRFLSSLQGLVATSSDYLRTSPVLQSMVDRVTVIPLTIDPSSYPETDDKLIAEWRARLGDPFFLFIGVLRYYKGLDYLLEAARSVPHTIAIAGEGPEGPRLHRLASTLSNVRFLGHVSDADKVALLHASRAVVFPSHLRSEAFGMALLEGAMIGKPLISCEIGTGTSFVNQDAETGIIVPPRQADSLAQAMIRLADDAVLAKSLGSAARRRFEQVFSSEVVGRAYCNLYQNVLANSTAH